MNKFQLLHVHVQSAKALRLMETKVNYTLNLQYQALYGVFICIMKTFSSI